MRAALQVAAPAAHGGARELALALFDALNAHDPQSALGLFHADAAIELVPAAREQRGFFAELVHAFPDLWIQIRSVSGTDELAVVELTLEGTQAADFLGILNQEKHLDLEQAWMVWAERGAITRVRAFWCQNQLYRRLAVKRLDRISILGET
jgi:ketosteroid isomerase-like protein